PASMKCSSVFWRASATRTLPPSLELACAPSRRIERSSWPSSASTRRRSSAASLANDPTRSTSVGQTLTLRNGACGCLLEGTSSRAGRASKLSHLEGAAELRRLPWPLVQMDCTLCQFTSFQLRVAWVANQPGPSVSQPVIRLLGDRRWGWAQAGGY